MEQAENKQKITIELTMEQAEHLSALFHNVFTQDFFDISMALGELYTMEAMLQAEHLCMDLKAIIDEELDKSY